MVEVRMGHSMMGIASLLLSVLPAISYLLAGWLVEIAVSGQPPGADQTGYGFGMWMLFMLMYASAVVALVLGVGGALQRRHKRTFAFVGLVCSVVVLAGIQATVGLGHLAPGM